MVQNSVDLTTCDREPIHIPGSIQGHGCLLACSADGDLVLRRSDNAIRMLALESEPIGKRLADVLGPDLAHALINALAKSPGPRRPGLLQSITLRDAGTFDVSVHSHLGTVIVEFQPSRAVISGDALDITRALISRTQMLASEQALNQRLPRLIQGVFGYDRVMIYEFAADGSGQVKGEAKRAHLESFLGQHFPAADIPQQARALYVNNTIRVISSVADQASPIVPELDDSGAALDLSFAHLRSVSPIHLEYLRNMGVDASMSVSLIVDGVLWGLVACHHYAPRCLTQAERTAAELLGDFLSLHLTSIRHRARVEATLRTRSLLDRLMAELSFHEDLETFLRDSLPRLATFFDCDGAGLWMNGIWNAHGVTPRASEIPALARIASEHSTNDVFATHAISQRIPEAASYSAQAAGALIIPLSALPRDYLFFFRKEKIQALNWAGDPNKTYESGPMGDRLTPRKSFAVWKETVQFQSDPWTQDDRSVAEALVLGLREIVMRQGEMLAAERKKAEIRQRVLHDELNHRVKNILSLIKSLVNQKTDARETLETYVSGLKGRILALSHAHDQVVRSDGGGSLHQLLQAEMSPYPKRQIEICGQDVGLDARAYSVMALVIHELATNAAKYGALSVESGRLVVSCTMDPAYGCTLSWTERGGPEVKIPSRRGFGSVLLDRSVPFDLQGTSEIDYDVEGVKARITIPLKYTLESIPTLRVSDEEFVVTKSSKDLVGSKVLLVEDQLVIALDAEAMLYEIGVLDLVTAASATDALQSIIERPPDVAVLDVNLGTGTSLPVAEELLRWGIPFVFATGYGDSVMIPERLRVGPIVRKPYTVEALKKALNSLFKTAEPERQMEQ